MLPRCAGTSLTRRSSLEHHESKRTGEHVERAASRPPVTRWASVRRSLSPESSVRQSAGESCRGPNRGEPLCSSTSVPRRLTSVRCDGPPSTCQGPSAKRIHMIRFGIRPDIESSTRGQLDRAIGVYVWCTGGRSDVAEPHGRTVCGGRGRPFGVSCGFSICWGLCAGRQTGLCMWGGGLPGGECPGSGEECGGASTAARTDFRACREHAEQARLVSWRLVLALCASHGMEEEVSGLLHAHQFSVSSGAPEHWQRPH